MPTDWSVSKKAVSATTRLPDSLIERLFHYELNQPTYDALVTPTIQLSYAELAERVRAQAQAFTAAGISAQAVVGIRCAYDPRHLLLCLAAIEVGAASCTIPSHESESIQRAVIDRCGVTHIVEEQGAPQPTPSGDPAEQDRSASAASEARLLFATSGTTGEPKLVIHHDRDLVAQAHRHIGSAQERFVCLATMEHNFAKRHRLYCVAAGATNVFMETGRGGLVEQCQALDVNVMHVSAFQAQELLAMPDISALSSIRLKLGGSHVPLPLRQQLRDRISRNLQAGYGTTETGAIAFTDPDDAGAGESVGRALPGIEISAMTADRQALGTGEQGELAVRCAGMFRGYLGQAELTASRLVDGWFYTGDLGYLDEQQRIHLCGRADDMFVFNSMNIHPQEIESQIRQHPDVTDTAVLPRTSSVHGKIPVALVVFAKGRKADLASLQKFVRQRVGVRSPRQYTIVDEIPRNAAGKIARREAIDLSTEIDSIRNTIAQALEALAIDSLNPKLIAAFEAGDKDIALRDIELDSLARMDLLIALETRHDVVITPEEFGRFRCLGDLVTRVLAGSAQDAEQPTGAESRQNRRAPLAATKLTPEQLAQPPKIVRLFRRMFRFCRTVTQLNRALGTLENRLTPPEVACLAEWHHDRQLVPDGIGLKFESALTLWCGDLQRMLLDSGKPNPEPFRHHRIMPNVTHFVGPGAHAEKTLLICFSRGGGRQLMMPNAVLLQHADAHRHDLLVIAEPLNQGYRLGVPGLGPDVTQACRSIANLELVGRYHRIRTLGCSAGGYAAVIAGLVLGAEMAVCVGGRFHAERYPLRILDRMYTSWRAARKGRCTNIVLSYATDKNRDRKYARFMARVTGGRLFGVEFSNGTVGHWILQRLVERGELAPYLANTVFAEVSDDPSAPAPANVVMSFPSLAMKPL